MKIEVPKGFAYCEKCERWHKPIRECVAPSKFKQERWSAIVLLDRSHVSHEFPLLADYLNMWCEPLDDDVLQATRMLADGSIEITCDMIEPINELITWVAYRLIPREVRLVRNGER